MPDEQHLFDVIDQLQRSPHLLAEQTSALRAQLHADILTFFAQQLSETQGVITPTIRFLADRLYDAPGLAAVLAGALRCESVRDLQRLLGHETWAECGEVRLIKAKGKLRFIQRVTSGDLLKSGAPADGRQRD